MRVRTGCARIHPAPPGGGTRSPTPASLARGPLRGDDEGCFLSALASLRRWGGVLEHPRDSKAWPAFGLPVPNAEGGWSRSMYEPDLWVCQVDQGHYGHAAQKPTWLAFVGDVCVPPPALIWGPSTVPARTGDSPRRGILERMSRRQRLQTPPAFAEVLLGLARGRG